ncbi:MAG TPA: tetratricopeptide repeat protein [Thermoflexales bacterium]|nr:tetratricopeptide repeat protein [Thermoflexales bacterium]
MLQNPNSERPTTGNSTSLGASFRLLFKHPKAFLATAAPLILPMAVFVFFSTLVQWPSLVAQLANLSRPQAGNTGFLLTALLCCGSIIVGVLGVLWPWMDGALTYVAIERMLGRSTGARAAWRATRPQWGALWATHVLRVAAMGSAWTFAAIPVLIVAAAAGVTSRGPNVAIATALLGIFCLPVALVGKGLALALGTVWSVAFPAAVAEGVDGFAALGRSVALTRGSRMRMFWRSAALVLAWGLLSLPGAILQIVAVLGAIGARGASGPVAGMFALYALGLLLQSVLFVLGRPLNAIYYAASYLDLRERQPAPEMIAVPQLAPLVALAPSSLVGLSARAPEAVALAPAAPRPPVLVRPPPPPATFAMPASLESARLPPLDVDATPAQRVGHYFNRLLIEGDRPDVLNDLGLAYLDVGDTGAAIDALQRAQALAPTDADIAYNLMRALVARGDQAGARKAMAEYLRLETNVSDRDTTLSDPRFKGLL